MYNYDYSLSIVHANNHNRVIEGGVSFTIGNFWITISVSYFKCMNSNSHGTN